jgi:hypothetical protein
MFQHKQQTGSEKMGAILELVNLASTPVGLVVTGAVAIGFFYFMRWILAD